jgi:hypothetical protein
MRKTLYLAGLVGALLVIGGVATASIPDPTGRIFACVASNGSITVKDDAGTGSVSCQNTAKQVTLAQYRPGVLYDLHHVTVSEQIPLEYAVGDRLNINVDCPYMPGSSTRREVATGAAGRGPQDWVLEGVSLDTAGAQVTVVAISTAHVGQVASATAALNCAKVTY